jgi:hypothetical protein
MSDTAPNHDPYETTLSSMKTLLLFQVHKGARSVPVVTPNSIKNNNAFRASLVALPGVKVRCVFTPTGPIPPA